MCSTAHKPELRPSPNRTLLRLKPRHIEDYDSFMSPTAPAPLSLPPFFQPLDQGSEIFMRLFEWQRRWSGADSRGAWLVTHDGKLSLLLFPLSLFCRCENVRKKCRTRCQSRNEINLNSFHSWWKDVTQSSTKSILQWSLTSSFLKNRGEEYQHREENSAVIVWTAG